MVNKQELLNRINQLDDIKLNNFLIIADTVLDLLYSGIDVSEKQLSFADKLKKREKKKYNPSRAVKKVQYKPW